MREILPKIGFYILVLLFAYITAFAAFTYLKSLSQTTDKNNHKIIYEAFSKISFYFILTGGVLFVLVKLGFNLNTILVVMSSVGLALALALQESIKNITSGIMILFMEYYEIGDLIDTDGKVGYIDSFNLFNTAIKNLDGHIITVPNMEIINKPLTNFYKSTNAYVSFLVNVSNYDKKVDINEISNKIVKILQEKCQYVIDKNDVHASVSDLSTTGTILKVKFSIESRNYIAAKNDGMNIVRETIKENGIFLLDYYYSEDKGESTEKKKI
jgi:small conductance mechanosensitive channel